LTYKKYLEAEKEFNEVVTQFGNDEVEINLSKIDLYDFVDGLVESEIDFTASQLQVISFIFNNIK
jgi:hypothetical protein